MTAGVLAGCGALFDDTGPGSSPSAATKSTEAPRGSITDSDGNAVAIGNSMSESTIPGERGSTAVIFDDGAIPAADASAETLEEKRARARRESGTPPSTPSSTPSSPAPAPAPVSSTINSLDTIVDDMRLMNDQALAGVSGSSGWATGPGHVILGNDPRGTHTPSWWNVYNSQYKSGAYWNAILPWFVVFDGVGNGARNTRVQLRNLTLYIKSKSSGKWNLTRRSVGVGGELYPKSLQGSDVSSPNTRTEPDGSTSVLPPSGNLVYHGWGSLDDIAGSDVAAVFITLQARLVKDNASGPDDRSSAKYLVHVGGDYYPDRSTRVSDMAPAYYFPGIGVSRAKMVSNDWKAFNFSTIDVGVEDPGGGVITESAFRAAPPPLE